MANYSDNFTAADGTAVDARDMSGNPGVQWTSLAGPPTIYNNRVGLSGGGVGTAGKFRTPAPRTETVTQTNVDIFFAPYFPNTIYIGCGTGGDTNNGCFRCVSTVIGNDPANGLNFTMIPFLTDGSATDFAAYQSHNEPTWSSSDSITAGFSDDFRVAGHRVVTWLLTNHTRSASATLAYDDSRSLRPTGRYNAFEFTGGAAGFDNITVTDTSTTLSAGSLNDPATASDHYSAQATQTGPVVITRATAASAGTAPYTYSWVVGYGDQGVTTATDPSTLPVLTGTGTSSSDLSWTGYLNNRHCIVWGKVVDSVGGVSYTAPVQFKTRMATNTNHLIPFGTSEFGYRTYTESLSTPPQNRIEHRIPRLPGDNSMPGYLFRYETSAGVNVESERHFYSGRDKDEILSYQADWQQALRDTGLSVTVITDAGGRNNATKLSNVLSPGYTAAQAATYILGQAQAFVSAIRTVAGQSIKVVVEGLFDIDGAQDLAGNIFPAGIAPAYNAGLTAASWLDGVSVSFQNSGDRNNATYFGPPPGTDPDHPNDTGNNVVRLPNNANALHAVRPTVYPAFSAPLTAPTINGSYIAGGIRIAFSSLGTATSYDKLIGSALTTGVTSPFDVTSDPDTPVTVQVRGVNSQGNGPWSEPYVVGANSGGGSGSSDSGAFFASGRRSQRNRPVRY